MGVGLVRSLQPWDILLTYCHNQFKKYKTRLLTLARAGTLCPLLMSVSEAFSVSLYTLIKLCYTEALTWSSLVPGSEAKSSLEMRNPTLFTVSYHHQEAEGQKPPCSAWHLSSQPIVWPPGTCRCDVFTVQGQELWGIPGRTTKAAGRGNGTITAAILNAPPQVLLKLSHS